MAALDDTETWKLVVAVAWGCGDAAARLILRLGYLRKVESSLVKLFAQAARSNCSYQAHARTAWPRYAVMAAVYR